ncbi:MAG: Putative DNA-binding domain protein [Candidatus Argoarchaeum ethanivorans]|uniref:DNA-binding domain protein n=1 Tax=Candidatus Argoarchaeum ethanivorans TaxID=2608793 RepID=A0A811T4N8_9EURY|nr:MAG: Putative DNA-binding domain protein [Candidatus Argoarchaeum ethanivorans]
MNIKELIERGESQSLEFKESLKLKDEIGETVSAFSNSDDGTVIVGVSDSGRVLGVDIGKNTLEELANYIKRNTDPQIFPSVKILEIGEKNVVMVEVEESPEKPAFFKNHAYKRIGKTNQMISSSELRKLAKESGGRVYWDGQVCEDASLDDIDEERIRQFLRKAKYERRLEIDLDILVKEALERLSLIKGDKLTNASILLFDKDPKKFFLQTKLRCARYKGTTPITFIDLKTVEGNIIDQVEKAENFVLLHIKKAAKIVGFERQEVWEYPLNALREAIVNAICHRDYACSSDITIGVFDDRVEISNPGTLPEPLTPEDLKKQHKSIPRNPLVANAFFLIRNIEQWGEGTNKIVKWCLEHGLREPDFEEIAGGFLVRFYAPEDILSLIPEPGKIDLEKVGLNERQIKALELMVNEGKAFTNKEYREHFGVSNWTCVGDMKLLEKYGFVIVEGKGKSTVYIASETPHESEKKLTKKLMVGEKKLEKRGSK